jgi:hypothetical protein
LRFRIQCPGDHTLPRCLLTHLAQVMRGDHGDANMMLLYLVATNMGDNRAEEGR